MIPLLIAGAVAYLFLKGKKSENSDADSEQEVKQNRIAALTSPMMALTRTSVPRPQTTSPAYTTPKVIRTPQTQIRPINQRRVR